MRNLTATLCLTLAVLLGSTGEGASEESNILLEPDAVLTGTGGYKRTGTGDYGPEEIICSFRISLKNYKFSQYLDKSNTSGCTVFVQSKLDLKFLPDGTLESGRASNSWRMYPMTETGHGLTFMVDYSMGGTQSEYCPALIGDGNYKRTQTPLTGTKNALTVILCDGGNS